jgi:hypothetical protein
MNKKKLIIVGAALLTAGLTYGQSRGTIERGVLGAVIGGVIGNNVGDGDSETGAIIGGVTAIIFGDRGNGGSIFSHGGRHHRGVYGGSRHHRRVIHSPCAPVYETIEIRRQVWVNEVTVRNAIGEIIHHVPGHYETRVEYKTVRVR